MDACRYDHSIWVNLSKGQVRSVYVTTLDGDQECCSRDMYGQHLDFLKIVGHNCSRFDGIEQLWFDVLSAHKDKTNEERENLHGLHNNTDDELRTKSQEACQLEFDITNLHIQLSSQKHMINATFNSSKTLQVYKPCGKPFYLERDTSQTYL